VFQELTIEEIVEKYQDRVYNTCLGFLKNEEEAQDVAQEVFINIFQHLERFKGDASLSTWIYRIAVNKSLEHIRKSRRLKRQGNILGMDSKTEQTIPANPFYHPGVELENKERAAILFGAIDQLAEPQKIAFTLHKVEGLSYEEISNIMEKSLSSIESLMHRAKMNLRTKLKDYYEEE
jgi:RNA polymerase sigma-70 factor (ECF subfamily)